MPPNRAPRWQPGRTWRSRHGRRVRPRCPSRDAAAPLPGRSVPSRAEGLERGPPERWMTSASS
jgi:hypothetical protein